MNYDFRLVAGDTDGIAFKKKDQKPFTLEEREAILKELNSRMDPRIKWEDDGVFKRQIVVAAKNYILQDESGKVKIKGGSLKATSKEKALKEFIDEVINLLLKDKKDRIYTAYLRYAQEVVNIKDISRWCSKKTVTKAVLNAEHTTQQRVLDALEESDATEGDKVYMFYRTDNELCLVENFDGTYSKDRLLGKLYDTICVFKNITDVDIFPNFSLERNKEMLGLKKKTKLGQALIKALTEVTPPLNTKITRSKEPTNTLPDSWNTK